MTGRFVADLVLQILAYVAQCERESIRERQAEGIRAAKMRGVKFGGKEKPLPDDFDERYRQWMGGKIHADKLALSCGFSRRTLFNKLKIYREQLKMAEESENP